MGGDSFRVALCVVKKVSEKARRGVEKNSRRDILVVGGVKLFRWATVWVVQPRGSRVKTP